MENCKIKNLGDVMQKATDISELLAVARAISGYQKLHIEIKIVYDSPTETEEENFIYEDGERLLSSIDELEGES